MTDATQPAPTKTWAYVLGPIWTAVSPWITGRIATAIAAVLLAAAAQYKIQGWSTEAQVSAAEMSATLHMAGVASDKAERRVDDVAAGAAQKCIEAFNAYTKAAAKKK